jgi:hypothetical protein
VSASVTRRARAVLRYASSAGGSHGMWVGAHGGGRCGCEPQLLGESVCALREVGQIGAQGVIFSSHMITNNLKTPDLEQVPSPTLTTFAVVVSIVARHYTQLLVSGYAYERVGRTCRLL